MNDFFLSRRPRRNRKSEAIRSLVEETKVTTDDLIFPLFLVDGKAKRIEVGSMPGIFRLSADLMLKEIEACMKLGVKVFDIFPAVEDSFKDKTATYSSDGHDGLVKDGKILNDETLEILGRMALAQAETGIDILGPSDMMDGRVGYLRSILDENGFTDVSIMSYTAKYASGFYNPFRDALDSAPKFGDKKTYQMNPANRTEALVEAELDAQEGADFLMVKPALAYLDIIRLLKDNFPLPVAAYNVSGEYSMVKAAAMQGWLDGDRVMKESLLSIKRAGADIILTYFAKEYAALLKKEKM
jgi:porphobilinogen synthase